MHIEEHTRGKSRLYYAALSFRHAGKVRKVRRYLGQNLSPTELEKLRSAAEAQLRARAEAYMAAQDPFLNVLKPKEMKALEGLGAGEFKIFHLSDADWKRFSQSFAYNTNAIEGSELTPKEVAAIAEKGEWPTGKPISDVAEAQGVMEAIAHLRETKDPLSLALIRRLHWLVFRNSKTFAGEFRRRGVEVLVKDGKGTVIHRGAPSEKVPGLLKELAAWYEGNKRKYPPLVLAAVVHNQFENIHPFADGNGRVGRLLLNYVLLSHGLPPVSIDLSRRKRYYNALQAYEKRHDLRPTVRLLLAEYAALRKRLGKK